MNSYDMKQYKLSRIMCNDLKIILERIEASLTQLSPYKIYRPVQRVLLILQEEKRILESHYEKYKEIRREKGRVLRNNE